MCIYLYNIFTKEEQIKKDTGLRNFIQCKTSDGIQTRKEDNKNDVVKRSFQRH